jgi:two-component system, LytTR family, response regulator
MSKSLKNDRAETPADRLLVKTNGHFVFVRAEEIDWIEAQGNYVRLHVRKKEFLLRRSITNLESRLDPRMFVRIHRSAIVNLDHVLELAPLSHGDLNVFLTDGTRLTWSRSYKAKLKEF